MRWFLGWSTHVWSNKVHDDSPGSRNLQPQSHSVASQFEVENVEGKECSPPSLGTAADSKSGVSNCS